MPVKCHPLFDEYRCETSLCRISFKSCCVNNGKRKAIYKITKVAAKYAENSKVAVRNIRRDYIENVRNLQKNGEISEDQKHQDELLIQQITDEIISNIDDVFSNKEKEILDN